MPATDRPATIESARSRARCASSMCRGSNSDATRSGGSPDWRVPSRLPAPRSSRSASAIAKPSFEPRTTSSRRMASSSVASESRMQNDRCVPRPTRPRSWCSCARPNRSASSITITLAFGTSIPTSITVVATSRSISPAAKAVIVPSRRSARCWPCTIPMRSSGSAARSRSASASALAAWSASDSATSGTTTKAWRPSAASAARKASIFGSARRSRISVRIGWRPGGRWRIVLIDRSPYTLSASVRGIGVAVSASTCGSPPLPLAWSAARCPTPKRCCSSTITRPSRGNSTASLITACVPITISAAPAAMASWISRLRADRQRPGQELGPHPEALEQRRQAGVVLPRQDLGRSHQRPLPAGANGAGQRHRRDRRLAAADVALQQAAHRPFARRSRRRSRRRPLPGHRSG